MGCDIHMVIERKRAKDTTWTGVVSTDHLRFDDRPPPSERNYAFFSRIADVRTYGDDVKTEQPKGVPEDASDLARQEIERWDCDGHSHSWMPLREFCLAYYEVCPPEDERDLRYPEARLFGIYPGDGDSRAGEQWRVVFWFDN